MWVLPLQTKDSDMYFDTSGTTRPFKILSGLRATEVLASGIVQYIYFTGLLRAQICAFFALVFITLSLRALQKRHQNDRWQWRAHAVKLIRTKNTKLRCNRNNPKGSPYAKQTNSTNLNIESLPGEQVNLVQLQHLQIVIICQVSGTGAQSQMVSHWKYNVLLFETFGPLVLSSDISVYLSLIRVIVRK